MRRVRGIDRRERATTIQAVGDKHQRSRDSGSTRTADAERASEHGSRGIRQADDEQRV